MWIETAEGERSIDGDAVLYVHRFQAATNERYTMATFANVHRRGDQRSRPDQ